jgi:hypothetical protein
MGSSFKALDIRLHPLPPAAIALPRGHVALAFVDVGVGFVDRAADVAVGFLRTCGLYRSNFITPIIFIFRKRQQNTKINGTNVDCYVTLCC